MVTSAATRELDRFDVSPEFGFLPDEPALRSLNSGTLALQRLDELGSDLPSHIETDQFRSIVRDLELPDPARFDELSRLELTRVYTVSGFLASAYAHQIDRDPEQTIPGGVAVPLYESAHRLDRTPVLSYDAYVLYNWRRVDPAVGMRPHNLESLVNFVDLRDEEWFIATHAAIEAAAAPALVGIGETQQGILDGDDDRVRRALRAIEESLRVIIPLLDRMEEHNDPERYGHGFRPYLEALNGVVFEGVPALDGPQTFRGASGAQSSIFPALDAAIGIDHGSNQLVHHLRCLRADMPPEHRAFIQAAADGPAIREFAAGADDDVQEAFNECIDLLVDFRERHIGVVEMFITRVLGDTTGTGGTPYADFLTMFIEDTEACKLD